MAGHPAPDFELAGVEGEMVRLSDFKGKPVIVNFWATWCAPCRAEFPEFQEAAVDNADRLVIIGVNNTAADQAEQIPAFLEEFGITFPIVLDKNGDTIKAYRILGLPTTIFIDSNGIVNEVFTGPLNKAYIESKISELTKS
jgi:peroxiredoxin